MRTIVAIVLGVFLVGRAHASLTFDGLTDKALAATTEVTAVPFTACCYMSQPTGADRQVLSFGDTAGDANWFALGNYFGLPAAATYAGTIARAIATTTTTANVWNSICGVFVGVADRSAFREGGSEGSNVTSQTPAGVDATGLAVLHRLTDTSLFEGSIAECGVWDVALTDAEVAQFAAKYSPRCIRPSNLISYYPLLTNEDGVTLHDFASATSTNLTITGAPLPATHPRLIPCQ